MNRQILGKWNIDAADTNSIKVFGNISMEFKANGELVYTIHLENTVQSILMIYEIHGDILITDQPSNPRKEQTKFLITKNDKLELFFEGLKSTFFKDI